MRKPAFSLTQDQIDFYFREGYLSIPSLTTVEDVAFLREHYDRIFAERAGRDDGNQFDLAGTDEEGKEAVMPQILSPAHYAPQMYDSLLYANAMHVVQQLFGADAKCDFAHAIFKPPRISPETPWHQDAAYWGTGQIYRTVSIWVPLQEATPENGCMYFVPHSHDLDVLPHRSVNNDPRIHALELASDQLHRVKDAVACPLPPGGATFHGGYMLHYTPPNRSNTPRRALILGGGIAGIPRKKPLHFPWMEEKRTAGMERRKKSQKKTGEDITEGVVK